MTWPTPLDGERFGAHRSTDNDVTAFIPLIPPMDDDRTGQIEQGWYDRLRADTNTRHPEHPAQRVAPRHRQDDDLPGPSRRELARLVRQVRALSWVIAALLAGAILRPVDRVEQLINWLF